MTMTWKPRESCSKFQTSENLPCPLIFPCFFLLIVLAFLSVHSFAVDETSMKVLMDGEGFDEHMENQSDFKTPYCEGKKSDAS